MSSWSSYPKIYNVGHAELSGYFDEEVLVEEKVDGSQFSFGVFEGNLKVRSKGVEMDSEYPTAMFRLAVDTVMAIRHLLVDGYTYRAEFLQKPKHNTLKYDRVPNGNLALFDVNTGLETYMSSEEKGLEAKRLGIDVVPSLYVGIVKAETLRELLTTESFLGGAKVEGVVCKRTTPIYGRDKKALLAKHVSEDFKEVHGKEWKRNNLSSGDFIETIGHRYRAEGRWAKAVQRLRDSGELTQTPQDIPKLLREVKEDILAEEREAIISHLLDFALPKIQRIAVKGCPEWYKSKLLSDQFNEEER